MFRQRRGIQLKPHSAFVAFQGPSTRNNQNTKVACFEVTYFATLEQYLPKLEIHVIFGPTILFPCICLTHIFMHV